MAGFAKGADAALPVIFSCSGQTLTESEKAFFQESNPLGFILFERNCETPEQLPALVSELKETVDRDCPVLIDQEGGKVQRMKPPHWRKYPAMVTFGETAETDGVDMALMDLRLIIMQLSEDLTNAGINVNCAPVADILTPMTHNVIGNRAFSSNSSIVAKLCQAACETFLSAGVTPILKHIPGHGRAMGDSHITLPEVPSSREKLEKDFEPFRSVTTSDIGDSVWGMTAHVLYTALDKELPASISPTIIKDYIRGSIGFGGILLSDDLDMSALSHYGDVVTRACKVLDAGCDLVLYCAGDLEKMEHISEIMPKISEETLKRLQNAQNSASLAA